VSNAGPPSKPTGRGSLSPELEHRIRTARERVAAAQSCLDDLLNQLEVVDRAEKTLISKTLQIALADVAMARGLLDELD
jgi:hypothetical protein